MFFSKSKIYSIGFVFFVIIFLFTFEVKSLDKFDKANNVSDYFSGIISLNENDYKGSYKYLRKLKGLEKNHSNYSIQYLYALVNSGNLKEAFNFSKKLEKQNLNIFAVNSYRA